MTAGEIRADVAEALAGQKRAADPARSRWAEANAGAGKTKVLVDRISRLLLAGARPERILCLTFTKAAAAEMVNRLSARLGRWTAADEAGLNAELSDLLDRPPEAEETLRARALFAAALDAPGGMHIRTIHSFCESLLGRFPLEAGVTPNFRVMDEHAQKETVKAARAGVFERAAHPRADGRLRQAFAAAAARTDAGGFDELMTAMVNARGGLTAALRIHGGADGVMAQVRAALGVSADETPEGVIADAARAADDGLAARLAAAWSCGAKTDKQRAIDARAWLQLSGAERAARWDDYAFCFLTKKRRPSARLMSKGAQEADPGAFTLACAEQTRVAAAEERVRAVRCAADTESLVHISAALVEDYEARKEAMAALDYDGLIFKARALLQSDGGGGWVHYKLDGGLAHVLVDESQDTSPEQWAVIEGLVSEFFAGRGAHEDRSADELRTLFAVGDAKQSIYGFQGADPEYAAGVKARLQKQAAAAGRGIEDIGLPVSFRSAPSVLRAVDEVFKDEAAREGLGADAVRHLPFRSGQAGLVELWPAVDPEERAEADPWDAPLDQEPEVSPPVRLAKIIADTVKGWLDKGEMLESRGRPVTPGDIMILVRRRAALAEALVRELKDRGVEVAGADRMRLTEQIAVQDLMALGGFTLLPGDDLTLACVLKGPLFDFDDDDLFALAHGREGTLWRALGESADDKCRRARTALAELLRRADFESPYRTFAGVLNGGGRRKWLERLGVDAAGPAEAFLARALEYEREHPPSMQGFLHWMRTGAPELKRDLEQAGGAVRVMTVHGSKGLEAPVVFLPDACAPPAGQKEARILWGEGENEPPVIWKPGKDDEPATAAAMAERQKRRRMAEYRRLLYVAMTRAKDRLYVCGFTGRNRKGPDPDSWYEAVRRAFAEDGPLAGAVVEAEHPHPEMGAVRRLMNPQTAAAESADGAGAAGAAAAPAPGWLARPAPAEPDPARPLAPSRPADLNARVSPPFEAADADGGPGARFKRGRLIHRLLESLPDMPEDARGAAAAAWLKRPAHGLTEEEQKDICAETLALISHPEFAAVFGPGSRAEVSAAGVVQTAAGPETVAARIDRLVIADGGILIADFKTNRPPPETEAGVGRIYVRQMALYRALMQSAFPGRAVECALIWTAEARLMRISADAMDAELGAKPGAAAS